MKKLLSVLILAALLLTGCNANKEVSAPGEEPAAEATETAQSAHEFYTAYKEATTRPVAVMVDNDNKDAWPHAGLTDAYLIYEVPVEGGSTRLMALFGENAPEKIGPVRSSRHYFLDYALEHDAIYTHFGYSPQALADIPALGVNNINGVTGTDANAFWRETKYVGDYHSAFTSMEKIKAMADRKDYRTDRQKAPLSIAPQEKAIEDGEVANTVKIPYSGFYSSSFSYDEDLGTYSKFMNGSPHVVQGPDKLAVKNIIIMQMKTYSLGDGSARINVETVGSGTGYYITRGLAQPITWEKTGRTEKTLWKNAEGEEIQLNPGQTWVMLLPSGVSPQIG